MRKTRGFCRAARAYRLNGHFVSFLRSAARESGSEATVAEGWRGGRRGSRARVQSRRMEIHADASAEDTVARASDAQRGVVLEPLFARIDETVAGLGVELEIVCVDDGSRDATLERLRARGGEGQAAADPRALAQLRQGSRPDGGTRRRQRRHAGPPRRGPAGPARADRAVLDLWEQGYDVVYGVRVDRSSDTAMKRLTASMFYRLFNAIADHPIPPSTGDFRLMDRQVVEASEAASGTQPLHEGPVQLGRLPPGGRPYVRPERVAGGTSWRYVKLFRFAMDGITAFTTAPLRVWTAVGLSPRAWPCCRRSPSSCAC